MLRVATPLVVLVLLAGCFGGDEPEMPAASPSTQTTAMDAAATNATGAANATVVAPPTPVVTPISYAGKSPVGFCVFPAGVCQIPVAGSEDYHLLDVAGQAKTLDLVVTYGQQLPGMSFYVSACSTTEEGSTCFDYQTGPSPFTVSFDLSEVAPGAQIGISVGSVNAAVEAVGMVFGPADFSVEGSITSIPVVTA